VCAKSSHTLGPSKQRAWPLNSALATIMKESPFGFQYTWKDLAPVRALVNSVLVFQIIGGILGLLVLNHSDLFHKLWSGAAFATFPGFLIGMYIQNRNRPGSLGENKIMVRRMGLIALVLFIAPFYIQFTGI